MRAEVPEFLPQAAGQLQVSCEPTDTTKLLTSVQPWYSSWKQLCLGVLNWTESSIWEGIMWIFCQRNPKLNRGRWDFFLVLLYTFLEFVWLEKFHPSTASTLWNFSKNIFSIFFRKSEHHSVWWTPFQKKIKSLTNETSNVYGHCREQVLSFFCLQFWMIFAFLNLSRAVSSSLKVSRCTCLLSQDSHDFTFQKLWHGIYCHVLRHCLTDL